jgi:hypothetical protein
MRGSRTNRTYQNTPPRHSSHRPTVETLEERLQPGDVLLGGMLGRSWLPPELTRFASEQALAASRAELTAVRFEHASTDSFYAAAGQNTGFKLILSSNPEKLPETATGSTADPGRAVNSTPKAVEPAFRDASGLTNDVLDQLLGDDLGQLTTSGKPDGLKRNRRPGHRLRKLRAGPNRSRRRLRWEQLDPWSTGRALGPVDARQPKWRYDGRWRSRVLPRSGGAGHFNTQPDNQWSFCPGRRRTARHHHAVCIKLRLAFLHAADIRRQRRRAADRHRQQQ